MIDTDYERAAAMRDIIDAHRAALLVTRQTMAAGWPTSFDLLATLRRWRGAGVTRASVIDGCTALSLRLADA